MSANEKAPNSPLTRETILRGLEALSAELDTREIAGEICLFGGTVMVLAFHARVSTKDVDALFQPAQIIHYPANRIPVKTQYLVEGLFEEGKL